MQTGKLYHNKSGHVSHASSMEARLPQDKLRRLCTELATWQGKKACKRQELEHLLGLLHFACTVVAHGRTFLRRLTNLLKIPSKPFHHLRLNQEARSDLAWWRHFAEHWKGVSLLQLSRALIASANVFTDASSRTGCGAVWGNLWLQGIWPPEWDNVAIMVKELVPVVLASALWGKHWAAQLVHFHVDNLSVVVALTKGSSKEPSGIVMHLLRCLSFIAAHFQFHYQAFHVPGTLNTLANNISRDHLHAFSSPQCPIPPTLWSLLVLECPDWTSSRWTTLFVDFTRRV